MGWDSIGSDGKARGEQGSRTAQEQEGLRLALEPIARG